MLFRSNKIMYDRATNTLWSQLLGEPIIGPLANTGIKLKTFPVALTTWGEWQEEYPSTTVTSLSTGFYSPSAYPPEDDTDSFYFDYRNQSETLFPVWTRDDRLGTKDEVLGLSFDDASRAYPVTAIQQERVINDTVGNTDVVIIGSAETSNVKVYRVDGLDFELPESEESKPGLPMTLIGSDGVEWAVREDFLVNTQDTTQLLNRIPASISFWFGWFAFHGDTDIFGFDNN